MILFLVPGRRIWNSLSHDDTSAPMLAVCSDSPQNLPFSCSFPSELFPLSAVSLVITVLDVIYLIVPQSPNLDVSISISIT